MSSLRDEKSCEDHNGVKPQEEQSKASHIAQFLPTSRRIVQFSNGKVILVACVMSILSKNTFGSQFSLVIF